MTVSRPKIPRLSSAATCGLALGVLLAACVPVANLIVSSNDVAENDPLVIRCGGNTVGTYTVTIVPQVEGTVSPAGAVQVTTAPLQSQRTVTWATGGTSRWATVACTVANATGQDTDQAEVAVRDAHDPQLAAAGWVFGAPHPNHPIGQDFRIDVNVEDVRAGAATGGDVSGIDRVQIVALGPIVVTPAERNPPGSRPGPPTNPPKGPTPYVATFNGRCNGEGDVSMKALVTDTAGNLLITPSQMLASVP